MVYDDPDDQGNGKKKMDEIAINVRIKYDIMRLVIGLIGFLKLVLCHSICVN